MSAHTPTPWSAEPLGLGTAVAITSPSGDICYLTLQPARARANAAFIVRAVNAHDALVAALEKVASCESRHPEDVVAVAREALEGRTS